MVFIFPFPWFLLLIIQKIAAAVNKRMNPPTDATIGTTIFFFFVFSFVHEVDEHRFGFSPTLSSKQLMAKKFRIGATTNLLFGTNRCNCNSLIFCASTCIVMKMKNGTKSYDRKQTLMTVNHSLIFLEGQLELSQSSCFLLSFCEG
jgi:hypothetical protein